MRNNKSKGTLSGALVVSLGLFAGIAAACGGDDAGEADTTTEVATDGTEAATDGTEAATDGTEVATDDPCGFDQALIEAARGEGTVNVVGSHPDEDAQFLGELFTDAYGIGFVYNRQPTADAVLQVDTALEAGALTVDAALLGEPSPFATWTTEGKLTELDPPNGDAFVEGLRDTTRYSLPLSTIPMGVLYNSSRISEADAIESWNDLTVERGDKVIAMADPATSGSSLSFHYVLSEELGADYLTSFAGKQNHITESGATLTQLTLTGEVDFALPGYESEVVKARKTGEPLDVFYLDEVVPATVFEVGVLAEAPHPNAGRLFAEFLVCDVVQQQLQEIGQRPTIEGVPHAEGLQDLSIRNLVAPNISDMIAKREAVVALFAAATG